MERKLAAILAADVVGYSSLMEQDEAGTLSALSSLIKHQVDPQISQNGGRIVKLMGDGILAEFSSAVDAVEYALHWQQQLKSQQKFQFRIGINLGDVIHQDGDIFGHGVNIAARLEALADSGGICVSDDVYRQIKGKVEASFENMGLQKLKNVTEPVLAFKVRSKNFSGITETSWNSQFLPLEKPSIAVLAFDNLSGDQEQEYFSDGISEDIITELSRFSELFVIARNSSFAFKGQKNDIKQTAEKLGVQYLLEGSVRKAGDRIRVTAQLIEAETGVHLWADKFDRQLEDIFEVQDDVVRSIVGVLPGRVAQAGTNQGKRKPVGNLTAYDYLLRGNHALAKRGESLKEAIDFYEKAIQLAPDIAAAHCGISEAEGMCIWDLSYYDDNPLDRAYQASQRAMELDPNDCRSRAAFGEAAHRLGQYDIAREHLQRALTLNPNSIRVLEVWAMLQAYMGDPEGAIETYNHALLLDPFSQDKLRREVLAESYYNMHEYQKAIDVLLTMVKLPIFYVHQQIAISYAQLGKIAESKHHIDLYRAELPEFYDEMLLFESHLRLCARDEDREHWCQGYRLVGLDV